MFAINGPPSFKEIDPVGKKTHFNTAIPITLSQLGFYFPLLAEMRPDAKGTRAFYGRKQKEAKPIHDFDDEAKKLYARLNLPDPTVRKDTYLAFDVPDVVWTNPTTGASLYIGNIGSAQNLNVLNQLKIYHIVNC